jgi:hypothetical protein
MANKHVETKKSKEILSMYETFCKEIYREDELINERTNWLLASQSIFFAAVAFSNGKMESLPVIIMALLGLFTSLSFFISIRAAIKSIKRYRDRLLETCKPHCTDIACFPQLDRDPGNLEAGFVAPKVVPLFFAIGWLILGGTKVLSLW